MEKVNKAMPRRAISAAGILSILTSIPTQSFLLATVSVASLNAALSPAFAATCVTGVTVGSTTVVSGVATQTGTAVTGVTSTLGTALTGVQTTGTQGAFLTGATLGTTSTGVVNGLTGQTGTAVTAVTPTFGDALTSVQTASTPGSFLTSATLATSSGNAVTDVTATTTPVTGIAGATTVNTVAAIPPGFFYQQGGSDPVFATNPPGIQNVQVVSGTPTTQNVVTA